MTGETRSPHPLRSPFPHLISHSILIGISDVIRHGRRLIENLLDSMTIEAEFCQEVRTGTGYVVECDGHEISPEIVEPARAEGDGSLPLYPGPQPGWPEHQLGIGHHDHPTEPASGWFSATISYRPGGSLRKAAPASASARLSKGPCSSPVSRSTTVNSGSQAGIPRKWLERV